MSEETTKTFESDTEVTNTNEEEIESEETTSEEESDETSDDVETEETDEEKAALKKQIEELTNKNQKLYQKLKSGYKKGVKVKESVKKDYVSKDDLRLMMDEINKEKEDESLLINTYDDAAELMPEIKAAAKEMWLSINKAYALVKGQMMTDEAYRNQVMQTRTANHWSFTKKQSSKADEIFSKWPKISRKAE